MITIAEALQAAGAQLRAAGVANDILDAQMLLAHALGCDRTHLIVNFRQALTPPQRANYEALVARRATREPLQYILGHQEFFGLDFLVTPAVLIPRPETELLVEETLRLATQEQRAAPLIIEVGTGSGCIAVALARELPKAQLHATDISAAALAVARENAARNGVAARISFWQTDLLTALPAAPQADFIVSNPPYIAAMEMPTLQREVRDWEPAQALTDDADGLTFYRRLLAAAPDYLQPGGYLLCEIGYQQADAVRALSRAEGWGQPEFLADLQGIPRTLVVQRRRTDA